ncbi:MAG: hypothetical protein RJA22_1911 [Verrucomicrobiota bacterium]|jgi:lipoprotein NlpI
MRFPCFRLAALAVALLQTPCPMRIPAAPAPVVETGTPEELLRKAGESARAGNRTEAIAICTQVLLGSPEHRNALALRGRLYSDARQDEPAVADFSKLLKLDPKATGIYQLRGWCQFRLGRFPESIADFDKVIELRPDQAPHHWQRGIALYYAGRYDDGRKQFELHQTVNPRDVENAAWHFLCTARQSGVDKARRGLIPIEGDPRVPMKEVQSLFAGKAQPADVLAAAKAAQTGPDRSNDGLFYAHLYLGLYHEATGDAPKALEHILKAATEFQADHAMGDVARVHARVLQPRKKGGK